MVGKGVNVGATIGVSVAVLEGEGVIIAVAVGVGEAIGEGVSVGTDFSGGAGVTGGEIEIVVIGDAASPTNSGASSDKTSTVEVVQPMSPIAVNRNTKISQNQRFVQLDFLYCIRLTKAKGATVTTKATF